MHRNKQGLTHQMINIQNLKHHVTALAGRIGERNVFNPDSLNLAADYISQQFKLMGYSVEPQEYKAKGVLCRNLEATQPGCGRANEVILFGAHYDTIKGCPGANDNATGIAALLEIARSAKQIKTQPSLRFVAFTNEEPPFFATERMGSWRYAHMARERGDNIKTAIILETLGYYSDDEDSQLYPPLFRYFYPNKGNFVAFVSNLRSHRKMSHFARSFKQHSNFPLKRITAPNIFPGVGWSDHSPFWLQGYKAFMITDTAAYRYPFYHSPKDTPDKINYTKLAEVTTAIVLSLASQYK